MAPFPWLLIGGGEPVIREDLAEIIAIFVERNQVTHVTIPSNGWFTERTLTLIEAICSRHPDIYLNFDLSYLGPPVVHDAIARRPGAFERLERTYVALEPLRRRFANLGVGATFPLSSDNQHVWRETLDSLIDDHSFDSVVIGRTRGEPEFPETAELQPGAYATASTYLEHAVRAGRVPGFRGLVGAVLQGKDRVMHGIIDRIGSGGPFELPCYATRLSVVITERGTVRPCEILPDELGELRDHGMDFQRIWGGEQAERMRARIWDTRCKCTHECNLAANILFNPRVLPKVAWEMVNNAVGRMQATRVRS
jgi:MoaA/NifB/PqqE/SkfB family radical SAM enzyme